MALLPGSPAIDAGDDATCEETDQRGVTRPQGAGYDIGAYEYNGFAIDITIWYQPDGQLPAGFPGEQTRELRVGGDSGKPIVVSNPESAAALAFSEIAQKIAQKVSVAALGTNNALPINIVE